MTATDALRRMAGGRGSVLAVLAAQGYVLALNGVGAPWIMASFGLTQPAFARALAWMSLSALVTFALTRMADRVGRRTILIACVVAESIAAVGVALATDLRWFVIAQIVLQASANAAVACSVVWMAEQAVDDKRAMHQANAGLALALGSGPCVLLMPWIATSALGWRALVWPVAATALLAAVMPADRVRLSSSTRASLAGAWRSTALVFVTTTVLSTIATAGLDGWRYVHMVSDAGIPPAAASLLVIGAGVLALGGFSVGASAANALGRVRTVATAQVVMVLSLACAFWGPPRSASAMLWLGVSFALVAAAGNAITVSSNTAINELLPPDRRATMFGWLFLAGSLGRIAAQWIVAEAAPAFGVSAVVGTLALVGLPSAALFVWLVPESRRSVRDSTALALTASFARSSTRWAARLAVIATAAAITLVALEGLVRVFAPRSMMVPYQDDIGGVSANKPDVHGRFAIPDRFETTITIHDRFRSAHPIARAAAPGTVRIATLGDSATFGWGSEDSETYPAALERVLNERVTALGSSGVEVLNAGVIATGTGEQALLYDRWVSQFSPSVVILTVYWNDVDDDSFGLFFVRDPQSGVVRPNTADAIEKNAEGVRRVRTVANAIPAFSWLSQHSQLLTWARQAPNALRLRIGGVNTGGLERSTPITDDELARFRGEIEWLRDRVRPNRLVVAFLPDAQAIGANWPNHDVVADRSKRIVATLRALSEESALPFFDGFSAMATRPDAAQLFFALDSHPNPAGNRVFAESLAEFLVKINQIK